MIVCSCFGITDREIERAAHRGGLAECPAGQGCGGCLPTIEEVVARSDAGRPADTGGLGASCTPLPASSSAAPPRG